MLFLLNDHRLKVFFSFACPYKHTSVKNTQSDSVFNDYTWVYIFFSGKVSHHIPRHHLKLWQRKGPKIASYMQVSQPSSQVRNISQVWGLLISSVGRSFYDIKITRWLLYPGCYTKKLVVLCIIQSLYNT